MTDPRDGFELLRATNPIDERGVEGPDSTRARELLVSLMATPRPPVERPRILSRRLRIVIALGVLALATTAAAWLWTRTVEIPDSVLCYQAADLDSDISGAPVGGTATADACIPVWRDGVLQNSDVAPNGSVPPLTACVAESGALAVFPTDETTVCETLGLAYPEPSDQKKADTVRDLAERLIIYFESSECIRLEDAESDVRGLLNETGFTEWAIRTQPAAPDRPCASHSFDPQAKTIHLVPIPEP